VSTFDSIKYAKLAKKEKQRFSEIGETKSYYYRITIYRVEEGAFSFENNRTEKKKKSENGRKGSIKVGH
jgi:hypothetical protein